MSTRKYMGLLKTYLKRYLFQEKGEKSFWENQSLTLLFGTILTMKELSKFNSFIQTISNFPIFNYCDVFKLNLLKYESSFSIENIFIHCIHSWGQRKKIKVEKYQKGDFNWKHHPNQTKLEIKFNFTRDLFISSLKRSSYFQITFPPDSPNHYQKDWHQVWLQANDCLTVCSLMSHVNTNLCFQIPSSPFHRNWIKL